jgi:hypothetical protein
MRRGEKGQNPMSQNPVGRTGGTQALLHRIVFVDFVHLTHR